ncbi:MAPEG family protein [Brevundimonas sp.]|uniref:MAPEG family protein n=1 Tax=Brevundimonas sp. TaxID=1871086 RepID=UPI0025DCD458|nr:MAPEG family protein [Brevundimonas sp.]
MSVELTMLVYATALLIVLVLIQALAGIRANGLATQAGPRDNLPPVQTFHGRASRTVDNHREGLLMFAPLVLVAAVMDISTRLTILGAQLFFWSRVAHAVLYLAGVPWLRAAAWGVGMAGIVLVLLGVLGLA